MFFSDFLRGDAIELLDEVEVEFPTGEVEKIDLRSTIRCNEGRYSINNGIIAIIENGVMYVTPWSKNLNHTLVDEEMDRAYFYVPFSSCGQEPHDKQMRLEWRKLLAKATNI